MEAKELNLKKAEFHYRQLLQAFGVDFTQDRYQDMVETPKRYVKALAEMLSYEDFNPTSFPANGAEDMVIQTGIPFSSLCRHHVLPFRGTATVAYIPHKEIIGLSKMARFVHKYSANFQTQEYLGHEIAQGMAEATKSSHVAVFLQAEHECMALRGACVSGAQTKTICLKGAFEKPEVRAEFLSLVG